MTQVTTYSSHRGVLRAVNEGKATVGVLPLPEVDREGPWWPHLERSSGRAPHIVARLPFVPLQQGPAQALDALVVINRLRRQPRTGAGRYILDRRRWDRSSCAARKFSKSGAQRGLL